MPPQRTSTTVPAHFDVLMDVDGCPWLFRIRRVSDADYRVLCSVFHRGRRKRSVDERLLQIIAASVVATPLTAGAQVLAGAQLLAELDARPQLCAHVVAQIYLQRSLNPRRRYTLQLLGLAGAYKISPADRDFVSAFRIGVGIGFADAAVAAAATRSGRRG